MQEKTSVTISKFIKFIEQCKRDYDYCLEDMSLRDVQTQDILHAMELFGLTYRERAKLSTKLRNVRKQRRTSKLKVQELKPLVDFLGGKGNININRLSTVLGEIRGEEKRVQNSIYTPRTGILENAKVIKEEQL